MLVLYPGQIRIWRYKFLWSEKHQSPWRNTLREKQQGENQQQTQPTQGTRQESNKGHIGSCAKRMYM